MLQKMIWEPHDWKFCSKLAATLIIKNYGFLLFCKDKYDRKRFPCENTAENMFIIWNEKKKINLQNNYTFFTPS